MARSAPAWRSARARWRPSPMRRLRATDADAFPRRGALSIDGTATALLRNTIVAGNVTSGTHFDVEGAVDGSSSHNLIGVDHLMTGIVHGTNGNQVGTRISPIDPRLGSFSHWSTTAAWCRPTRCSMAARRSTPATTPSSSPRRSPARRRSRIRAAPASSASPTARTPTRPRPWTSARSRRSRRSRTSPIKTTLEDTPLAFSFNVGDADDRRLRLDHRDLQQPGPGDQRRTSSSPAPDRRAR